MATPVFQNDPAFVAYMEREYQRLHQEDLFISDARYGKRDSHAIAFQRALAARQRGEI